MDQLAPLAAAEAEDELIERRLREQTLEQWRRKARECYQAAYDDDRAPRYAQVTVPRALRDDHELIRMVGECLRGLCGCQRVRFLEEQTTGRIVVRCHIRTRDEASACAVS